MRVEDEQEFGLAGLGTTLGDQSRPVPRRRLQRIVQSTSALDALLDAVVPQQVGDGEEDEQGRYSKDERNYFNLFIFKFFIFT